MAEVSNYTSLLSGTSWSSTGVVGHSAFVTYSFETSAQSYLSSSGYSTSYINSFQAFSSADQDMARNALNQWAAACGITFLEVPTGQGDIRFGNYDFNQDPENSTGVAAYAYHPSLSLTTGSSNNFYENPIFGDVFVNWRSTNSVFVLLHELGHSIGLKHPFDGDPKLITSLDNHTNTIMSYTGTRPSTLGPFDIQAAQSIYGTVDGGHLLSWNWNATTFTLTQIDGDDAETIIGVSGSDIIQGAGGDDRIAGRGGDDVIDAGLGSDTVFGCEGSDFITGGGGNDNLYGGQGQEPSSTAIDSDTVNYGAALADLTIDLYTYTLIGSQWINAFGADIGNDQLSGFENVNAGAGNDTITGSDAANQLIGNGGADLIRGYDGNDLISGGAGTDRLYGDSGNDILYFDPADAVIDGGSGIDTARATTDDGLAIRLDAWNVEILYAGGGNDAIFTYGTANYAVDAGAGNDIVTGNAFHDTLGGNEGNDMLFGLAGNDMLGGGNGDDTLNGGADIDQLRGENGNDTLYFDPADAVIDGGLGIDTARATTDDGLAIRLDAWNVEILYAGGGNDTIFTYGVAAIAVDGGGGNDSITGNLGADTLIGNNGDDVLVGLSDNDVIAGGFGSDRLMGSEGADLLIGESGADAYVFRGLMDAGDVIQGFEHGVDAIEIYRSGFTQPSEMALGAFDPARFTIGVASGAYAQFVYNNTTGQLFWDGDGSGSGGAQLLLTTAFVNNLSAQDFIVV